ncbi:DUF981 family protein [Micromonospora sp. NPDC048999]|uniref:DUF981 family protein n=1 Tax=Micromonospora sp. NPDC048999 TaxID=3155391 RepID=UPI0033E5A4A4
MFTNTGLEARDDPRFRPRQMLSERRMCMYTTMMGLSAGAGLILVALLGRELHRGEVASLDGWALALGTAGVLLAVSGLHMVLTQSIGLEGEQFKNEFFGGLTAPFGFLLIAAAIFLWRRGDDLLARPDPVGRLYAAAGPPAVLVLGLGLSLIAVTVAAFQHEIFATAPVQEPILGTAPKWLVNAGLSSLFGLPGVGATLAPIGVWLRNRPLMAISGVAFTAAGAGWMLTGALVYYTHIGMAFV